MIGETVRRELFGSRNPVGDSIRIRQFSCEVVGLLVSKGQSAMGRDQDDVVVMPLRAVQRRLTGSQDVSLIMVSVRKGASTDSAIVGIKNLLRERRRIGEGENDDFNVMDTRQIAETLTGTTRILTALLGAVAAVSLLVGGIGIMNIMLVSVAERTREIGIRLAIGALENEVLLQFLIEAVVLASLGGSSGSRWRPPRPRSWRRCSRFRFCSTRASTRSRSSSPRGSARCSAISRRGARQAWTRSRRCVTSEPLGGARRGRGQESSISRTRSERVSAVNGFWRKATPSPGSSMAPLLLHPDM